MTTEENIEAVKKMPLDNRSIGIREVDDDIGISFGSCQAIFTDIFGMKRVAPNTAQKKFMQIERRMDIVQEMLTTFNGDPYLLQKKML